MEIIKKSKLYANFGLTLFLLFATQFTFTQINQFLFNDVGMAEEYKTVTFCRINNYYWDQGVMDRNGKIHFVFVDNYKLVCFTSADTGQTWTKEQIITGKEGYVFTAMMALTQNDKRVITFAVNTGFNNGTVGFGSEFKYDVLGAVEQDDGSWTITPLFTHTTNNGLLPYGMITVKSGMVHAILYKYGWYNYGGELHEVIYNPTAKSWSSIQPIKIFNDRNIDKSTIYVGKTAEGENESILCMYQRDGTQASRYNVEIVVKTSEGWQAPVVILENTSYSTYNRFDVDYDRKGNTFIGYFEPWSASGPQIFLAHNSIGNFTKYELFQPADTLLKMSIHPYKDQKTLIYCTFKQGFPKILEWTPDGLVISEFFPEFMQEDSMDVKRFQYNIPRKNNFSECLDLIAFTNRYGGKTGDIVNSYPIVFSRANLVRDVTGIPAHEFSGTSQMNIFPNPADDIIELSYRGLQPPRNIFIYNAMGSLVLSKEWRGPCSVNISELGPGVFFIVDQERCMLGRFVKK